MLCWEHVGHVDFRLLAVHKYNVRLRMASHGTVMMRAKWHGEFILLLQPSSAVSLGTIGREKDQFHANVTLRKQVTLSWCHFPTIFRAQSEAEYWTVLLSFWFVKGLFLLSLLSFNSFELLQSRCCFWSGVEFYFILGCCTVAISYWMPITEPVLHNRCKWERFPNSTHPNLSADFEVSDD